MARCRSAWLCFNRVWEIGDSAGALIPIMESIFPAYSRQTMNSCSNFSNGPQSKAMHFNGTGGFRLTNHSRDKRLFAILLSSITCSQADAGRTLIYACAATAFWSNPRNSLRLRQARRRILPEMSCSECRFRLDPANESQVVCPACGADPIAPVGPSDDSEMGAAFEDGAAFAEASVALAELFGGDAPMEPEIDYVPDPELDLVIADGAALREALIDGPLLVAGNELIN